MLPAAQVDTHVHHSACMHQKHLLRFIKSKLRKEPDEVVIFRDGKWLTLREVFESLNLTGCAPLWPSHALTSG
jgi:AMP deaminase